MRVIAGSAKGHTLLGPKSDKIRPVLDKVKGAIFNILGDIQGARVLDLFAGTGAVGIEALSRGAAHGTFVDGSREGVELIRRNLERCKFKESATIVKFKIPPIPPFAKGGLDLIFVDPPYDRDLVNPTLRAIAREKLLAAGGIVVVEHSPRELIADDCGLAIVDTRKYGQTLVSFLR